MRKQLTRLWWPKCAVASCAERGIFALGTSATPVCAAHGWAGLRDGLAVEPLPGLTDEEVDVVAEATAAE